MDFITVTRENLAQEHICCAISNNTDCQVAAKKAWLNDRFSDGLVFRKGDVRGKCFIEYLPAERAWAPVEAPGYLYIDCLWVSGSLQGHGYARTLLDDCIRDGQAQGKRGLVILSADKKRPFLADPKFLARAGFSVTDDAPPFFRLMALPFHEDATPPRFRDCAKVPQAEADGFVVYYTHQCPYTAKYVPLLEAVAQAHRAPFRAIHIQTTEQAQSAPAPFTSFSLFYDGAFVTHEIQSEKRFAALLTEKGFPSA